MGANEDLADRVMYQERVPWWTRVISMASLVLPFTVLRKETTAFPSASAVWPGAARHCGNALAQAAWPWASPSSPWASVFPSVSWGGDWTISPRVFQSFYFMTLIKLYCGKGSEDSRVSFIGQATGRISGWVLAFCSTQPGLSQTPYPAAASRNPERDGHGGVLGRRGPWVGELRGPGLGLLTALLCVGSTTDQLFHLPLR